MQTKHCSKNLRAGYARHWGDASNCLFAIFLVGKQEPAPVLPSRAIEPLSPMILRQDIRRCYDLQRLMPIPHQDVAKPPQSPPLQFGKLSNRLTKGLLIKTELGGRKLIPRINRIIAPCLFPVLCLGHRQSPFLCATAPSPLRRMLMPQIKS